MTARLTRRALLAGTASVSAGVAGCLGGGRGSSPVSILAAGSLQKALSEGLSEAADAEVTVEAYGSRHAAQLVAEGQRDPDVLALADTALFNGPLATPWHATFASNALVLAYNPDSDAGQRVPAADRWYEPLADSSLQLGRTDPAVDPLGYRTLLLLDLAEEYYGKADLREQILGPDQVFPETQLLTQFETGSVDAAVVYRNMAVERDYPVVDLPAELDLSDPALAEQYASATVELDDGTAVTGAPIAYGATCRSERDAARSVFETLVASGDDYLADYGFVRRDAHPAYHGDVPTGIND